MSGKVKVLVTGAVNGNFEALNIKLNTLQKSKAGPFHICFCVGPLFSSTNSTVEKSQQFLQEGTPIPLYFCDIGTLPNGITLRSPLRSKSESDEAEISLDDDDDDNEDTPISEEDDDITQEGVVKLGHNIYHLYGLRHASSQTADIIDINISNLDNIYITVAFVPANCQKGSPQAKLIQQKTDHPSYLGCDILLSSEWGQGMAGSNCISDGDRSKLNSSDVTDDALNEMGSYDIAEFVSQTRPRYHFAPASIPNLKSDSDNNIMNDKLFFIQSLPYSNPPSASASGLVKKYHYSRFLALCNVVDAKQAKAGGKAKKFIHALGIEPLWRMDHVTATAVPEGLSVMACPYTDQCYTKDVEEDTNDLNSSEMTVNTTTNIGLSEAQTRRILSEEMHSEQYRWNVRNHKKRPLDSVESHQKSNDEQQIIAANDPENCTLFLHGLKIETSGGVQVMKDAIISVFKSYGCTNVFIPGNNGQVHRYKNFCFLDFHSHDEAAKCLEMTNGQIVILQTNLNLRWSSGGGRGRGQSARSNLSSQIPTTGLLGFPVPLPPPPPPPPPPKKQKRERLTEAEAVDSSSLFVHLNSTAVTQASQLNALEHVRKLIEQTLANAMNDGITNEKDKITAEKEPALQVALRTLSNKYNFAFLDFASHAAASMALATLTGSTDGGYLLNDIQGVTEELAGTQLWWAKSKPFDAGKDSNTNSRQQRFEPDKRTDCWFCLASPTFEKHLIVSVFNTCYVAMPKGPADEFHALIIPVNHSPNSKNEQVNKKEFVGVYSYNDEEVQEIENVKSLLCRHAHEALNKDLFVFERAIPTRGGYHAHINCVPIDKNLGSKMKNIMLEMASNKNGFNLTEIQKETQMVSEVTKNSTSGEKIDGYFYAEIFHEGSSMKFLYKNFSKSSGNKIDEDETMSREKRAFVPINFGRNVLASVTEKDIGHWKACVVEHQVEKDMTEKFRLSLAKYQ
mmetsp:Transcript_10289/g.14549  ORF Transcript_10289/g.14549 Transcript_10289/m.14549 type:complete len:962 (-) Transcript_10289:1227-4112(-)